MVESPIVRLERLRLRSPISVMLIRRHAASFRVSPGLVAYGAPALFTAAYNCLTITYSNVVQRYLSLEGPSMEGNYKSELAIVTLGDHHDASWQSLPQFNVDPRSALFRGGQFGDIQSLPPSQLECHLTKYVQGCSVA